MNQLLVKSDEMLKKINCDDIYFFTCTNSKTYAELKDIRIEIKATLNYIGEIVNDNFVRTHKSFLVNTCKIDTIEKFTDRTYNIKFCGTSKQAFITKVSLKTLQNKFITI